MQNLQAALDKYRTVAIFLALVILVSLIFASICWAARGTMRQAANDPQVEVTDQVAGIIRQGVPLDAIVGGAEQIDVVQSDALFVMIFDKDKNLAGSSAVLNGQPLSVPGESFDQAKATGDYRFDWQVSDDRKVAAVMKPVDDTGYVLAGRSLAEYEKRANALSQPLWIGWIASVLTSLLLSSLLKPKQSLAIIEETNVTVVEEPQSSND